MKIQSLLLNAIIFFCGIRLFGGEVQFDNHGFLLLNAALTAPYTKNEDTSDLGFTKTNAEALCLLEKTVLNTSGISNSVKLRIILSALTATTRYLRALNAPDEINDYIASSNLFTSLSLLDDSLKTLEEMPIPSGSINVGAPGVPAAGMDPAGVKDPKIRAEYERRIAENEQKNQEVRLRVQVERNANDLLKRAIAKVIQSARSQNMGEVVQGVIANSKISEKLKKEFTSDQ